MAQNVAQAAIAHLNVLFHEHAWELVVDLAYDAATLAKDTVIHAWNSDMRSDIQAAASKFTAWTVDTVMPAAERALQAAVEEAVIDMKRGSKVCRYGVASGAETLRGALEQFEEADDAYLQQILFLGLSVIILAALVWVLAVKCRHVQQRRASLRD